jgi:hypothetical protein
VGEYGGGDGLDGRWADFRFLLEPPQGLKNKILKAVELYPCDLLFVHRDAEGVGYEERKQEIDEVIAELKENNAIQIPAACVVPVRMLEAWLLIDESAIRRAAGNPNGRMQLGLPRIDRMEAVPDPKSVLFNALRVASGHTGRRLAKLNLPALRHRVAEVIADHTRLRKLPAFRALENEVSGVIATIV